MRMLKWQLGTFFVFDCEFVTLVFTPGVDDTIQADGG
jgi:hypothetical protein